MALADDGYDELREMRSALFEGGRQELDDRGSLAARYP
jgi:hypothetical protein